MTLPQRPSAAPIEPKLTYSPEPIEQTALLVLAGYISLLTQPETMRQNNYVAAHQAHFSDLAARNQGAWFLLSGLIRVGAWLYWGSEGSDSGTFRGWYDAMLVTLAVPVWHYSLEKLVWGSPTAGSLVFMYAVDGVGGLWLWWIRGKVLDREGEREKGR